MMGHVREYSFTSSSYIGKKFINTNLSFADSPILCIAAMFNEEISSAGCGFLVMDYQGNFISAGSCRCHAVSVVDAEAMAISFALYTCSSWGIILKTIFSSNEELVKAVKEGFFDNVWRMNLQVHALRELLANFGGPRTDY